jgi:hypothetical protein
MPVPMSNQTPKQTPNPTTSNPTPHRLLRSGWAWLLILLAAPLFARVPEPTLRIPLENLGFQPLSPQFLLNGSSMLTLHYIDDKHLLFTFVTHRLIPRLPDEPSDDQDRIVDALLLELPTGKILTRTSWHLHDRAQYLWNLGHGHFLLRVRDTLTTFAPLANLSTGHPFDQAPFLISADRRLSALILSPESDLLIIETVKRTPPEQKPKTPLFDPTPAPKPEEKDPVQVNFYRLRSEEDGSPIRPVYAGAVAIPHTGDIPATVAGYLAVVDQGRQHWAFDFHSYSGKVAELSPFDSSCSPAPLFVSHSEFIAFGCRGGPTMHQIGGFNMRGEEMWEQGLFGDFIAPSMAYAPAGGRFALSRIMVRTSAVPDQMISNDEVSSQTVVVYQTGTGKQLIHADCAPVERAGQNFTLSPDGLALAIVHVDAIEIYNLPPLSDKDEAELKLAQSSAPPESNLPVRFTTQDASSTGTDPDANAPQPKPQPKTQSDSEPPATPAATTNTPPPASGEPPASPQPSTPAPEAAKPLPPALTETPASQPSGDPEPDQQQHRTPPTIYTLPGDKPPASPKEPPQ